MEQVKMNEEHENTDLVDDYSKKKRILQEVAHDDAPEYEGNIQNPRKPL